MEVLGWVGGSGHASVGELLGADPAGTNYFKWAFVRNPCSRLVSAFCHLRAVHRVVPEVLAYRSFRDFVLDLPKSGLMSHPMFCPQVQLLCINGQLAVDFVGRYEDLGQDFCRVCRRLGKLSKLDHHNGSGSGDWWWYYEAEMLRVVFNLYAAGFYTFKYSKAATLALWLDRTGRSWPVSVLTS